MYLFKKFVRRYKSMARRDEGIMYMDIMCIEC